MIERKFVKQKMKEHRIQEYLGGMLKNAGYLTAKLQKTPLGEKIIIYSSRPGLIVGKKGENIRKLQAPLKSKFKLENPEIEISEVEDIHLSAKLVADKIASTLERFGSQKFKAVGHRVMTDTMGAGALGIEILITGKIPGSRAKRWRFYQGYLKKCGDIAVTGVRTAYSAALLKTGTVGIQVRIMPPDVVLPDRVEIEKVMKQEEQSVDAKESEVKEAVEKAEEETKEAKEEKPKKKKATKKKATKKETEDKDPKEAEEKANEEKPQDTPSEEKKVETKAEDEKKE